MADRGVLVEELVELALKRLWPAIELDHARHVMLDAKRILPAIGLRVIVEGNVLGIEGTAPGTVRLLAAEEAGGGVEHVRVVLRALGEERGILGLAQGLGHLGNAPIVKRKLQCAGGGLRLLARFGRDVAELLDRKSVEL